MTGPSEEDVAKALAISDEIDKGQCLDYCDEGVFAHDTFRQLARWYVEEYAILSDGS